MIVPVAVKGAYILTNTLLNCCSVADLLQRVYTYTTARIRKNVKFNVFFSVFWEAGPCPSTSERSFQHNLHTPLQRPRKKRRLWII